jgi:hypothetical protein
MPLRSALRRRLHSAQFSHIDVLAGGHRRFEDMALRAGSVTLDCQSTSHVASCVVASATARRRRNVMPDTCTHMDAAAAAPPSNVDCEDCLLVGVGWAQGA